MNSLQKWTGKILNMFRSHTEESLVKSDDTYTILRKDFEQEYMKWMENHPLRFQPIKELQECIFMLPSVQAKDVSALTIWLDTQKHILQTCEKVTEHQNELLTSMIVARDQISDLLKQQEDVAQYVQDLEHIWKDVLNVTLGDFMLLEKKVLLPIFPDKEWKRLIKDKSQSMSRRLVLFHQRIHLLQGQITHHWTRKRQQEERVQYRNEIAKRKALEKQRKQEDKKLGNTIQNISLFSSKQPDSHVPVVLMRMQTRVKELFRISRSQALSVEQRDELCEIESYLDDYNEEIGEKIMEVKEPILKMIGGIRQNAVQVSFDTNKDINIGDIESNEYVYQPSELQMALIEVMNGLVKKMNYVLSSTRNDTGSHADGSFAMKIFRPTLRIICNDILLTGKAIIDAGISWKNLVEILEKDTVDVDPGRAGFRHVLKNFSTMHTNVDSLLTELYQAIEIYSKTGFFHGNTHKSNPLQHFLQVLSTHIKTPS